MTKKALVRLSLEQRIKTKHPSMADTDRRLAATILEFPGDVLMLSATELADRANVSKAAVSRFVRRLDYSDFREMKHEIRDAQMSGAPIFLNRSDLKSVSSTDALQQHLNQDIENLHRTLHSVDTKSVEELIAKILSARTVWCLGMRNSAYFSAYVRRQLVQIRNNVSLLPSPGQTLSEELSPANEQDLIIIIGLRRRTPQLHRIMEVMHKRGVPIAYFTDLRAISTLQYATWNFRCAVRGTSLFDSYVGLLSLLNFISAKTAAAAGKAGRKHLEEVETLLGDLDELFNEN